MIPSDIRGVIGEFSHALPIGICIIDRDRKIILWNRTLADWSGRICEEMEGQRLDECYPHLQSLIYRMRIDQVLEGGPPAIFSSQLHESFIPCTLRNGTLRIQHTSIIRYPDRDSDEILAMIIIEDVTELNREIRAFRSMRDQAVEEVIERTKAEKALLFINRKLNLLSSITRHDILNEVTVLLGNASFLEEKIPDEGEERHYMNAILRSTERIQKQITFTRDYEELGIREPNWFRINEVAQIAFSMIQTRNVKLIIQDGSILVFADPMLEKVFSNIFSNAIMHGQTTTTITVSWKTKPDGTIITIADDGVGIPDDLKERIFHQGFGKNTGFGLFLSREILEITGLSIKEVGEKGAQFEIYAPHDRVRAVDAP